MTRELVRIDAADSTAVFRVLRAALSEHGPAVLPLDAGAALVSADAAGVSPPATVAHDIALVIETSGSTGNPKRVALSADALLASAAASAAALGGEGQWLLALPVHYIAGAQVLVRSICAGTQPVLVPAGHFDPFAFTRAARMMTADRRFVSLVPVQLARLLDAVDARAADARSAANGGEDVLTVLRDFDRILVGGQAMGERLGERARAAGLSVVRTYGSSETAGGCVYNGTPIGSVRARAVGGLLELSGPTLAAGYLGDPARTESAFHVDDGTRWYRTGDLGELDSDGTVRVLGRSDNVIISGGEKVSLDAIERLVHAMVSYPQLSEALVVAEPSADWGQVPVLVVAGAARVDDADVLSAVRAATASALGVAARPARLVRTAVIPRLPSGKPDRQSLAAAVGS